MDYITQGLSQAFILIATLNPEVVDITLRTLSITFTATLIASIISVPLGLYISFNNFFGKKTIISLIQTLYALPTVVVGLLMYMLLSNKGPLGIFGLLFTPSGMIIGQTVLIIPIITGLTIAALSNLDPGIRDTARSLGATVSQFFLSMLKEARFAILAAVVMGFSRAISEVGAAIMIGGNIRGQTRILTTTITLETGQGNFSLSIALGIILLLIALIVNMIVSYFQQR
ncbi:ABC transporter permease [Methanomicrobium antiquum]|uniref:ABC transporter permease n=1 Tax=Methanomicrobium antiquum TaxID=487686 RepID=A0AAF0JME1_9EURY|nr:ABC transporter permease [Methanomicrobium antiquum]MDD3977081.1 ABC transporter permease [Methanomicrobium sp.]WFN37047.1 ABC transporter permease [Methanomicrobium antiquum]